ncbi:MAG: hypothetical protein LBK18_04515 [Prevotellaceae bacterium]|jgi:hypothetical protein|nr:hypothetical protein [Prevotellaceae bacterium]
MKQKIFILAALLLSVSYAAQAQYTYKPFRIDIGTGLSFPVTTFGIGILGSIEPQYSFGQFGVGARIEYHLEGYETENDGGVTKYNNAILLTGDYRFSSATYRPFVGVGFGSYLTAANFSRVDNNDYYGSSGGGSTYRIFGQKVGAMLRAGFDLPHFRFALNYHITGSSKYEGVKVNFSYLAFTIAVGIGGGRVD